jgi:hypothetical protein
MRIFLNLTSHKPPLIALMLYLFNLFQLNLIDSNTKNTTNTNAAAAITTTTTTTPPLTSTPTPSSPAH